MAASTASAQVCGTNGTLNNLEQLILTGSQQQQLLCFRENSPQNTRVIGTVTGLNQGELLLGIDYRSADGSLIGLTNQSRVVTINQQSGATTPLVTLTANNQTVQLQGNSFGFDENPTSKALRIVTNTGLNLRQGNQANGQFPATVTDTALAAPGAQAPTQGVAAAAYNNVDNVTQTATLLFGLDSNLDMLVTQTPANNGLISPIGQLGRDIDVNSQFDIFTRVANGNNEQLNRGFGVSQAPNQTAVLFEINLETGLTDEPRNFANGVSVVGFAIPLAQAGNLRHPIHLVTNDDRQHGNRIRPPRLQPERPVEQRRRIRPRMQNQRLLCFQHPLDRAAGQ